MLPPLSDTCSPQEYIDWKQDVVVWALCTNVPPEKMGLVLLSSLTGKAKSEARYLPLAQLSDANLTAERIPRGVQAVFDKLDTVYVRDPDAWVFQKWFVLCAMQRSQEESLASFVERWEKKKLEMALTGMNFESKMLAMLFLFNAQLSDMQHSLISSVVKSSGKKLTEITYDQLMDVVKSTLCGMPFLPAQQSNSQALVALQVGSESVDNSVDRVTKGFHYRKGHKGKGKGKSQYTSTHSSFSSPSTSSYSGGKSYGKSKQSWFQQGKSQGKKGKGKGDGKLPKTFQGHCYRCGKYGHSSKYCSTVNAVTDVSHLTDSRPPPAILEATAESSSYCVSVYMMEDGRAIDPTVAILDTACTRPVVGEKFLYLYSKIWKQKFQRLEGVNDFYFGNGQKTQSLVRAQIPVFIGGTMLYMATDVLPNSHTPFLLSLKSMRKLGFKLDMESDTLSCTKLGLKDYKLSMNAAENYVIPILPKEYCEKYGIKSTAKHAVNVINRVTCSEESSLVTYTNHLAPGAQLTECCVTCGRKDCVCLGVGECPNPGHNPLSQSECHATGETLGSYLSVENRSGNDIGVVDPTTSLDTINIVSESQVIESENVVMYMEVEGFQKKLLFNDWTRNGILKLHRKLTHMSKEKMWTMLRSAGADSKHRSLVLESVDSCPHCAVFAGKPRRPKVGGFVASEFNQLIGIDVTEVKYMGRKFSLMLCLDIYSRFTFGMIIPDKSASSIVEVLFEWANRTSSFPSAIITDNGSEFNNKKVFGVCDVFDIMIYTTAPYSPWSNGITENRHKVVKECFVRVAHDLGQLNLSVQSFLSEALRGVNNMPRADTSYTPSQIAFALFPRKSEIWSPAQISERPKVDVELHDRLVVREKIRQFITSHECITKINRAVKSRQRDTDEPFFQGEQVYLLVKPDKNNSIGYYEGPYIVTGVCGSTYDIKRGLKRLTVSGHLLRRKSVLAQPDLSLLDPTFRSLSEERTSSESTKEVQSRSVPTQQSFVSTSVLPQQMPASDAAAEPELMDTSHMSYEMQGPQPSVLRSQLDQDPMSIDTSRSVVGNGTLNQAIVPFVRVQDTSTSSSAAPANIVGGSMSVSIPENRSSACVMPNSPVRNQGALPSGQESGHAQDTSLSLLDRSGGGEWSRIGHESDVEYVDGKFSHSGTPNGVSSNDGMEEDQGLDRLDALDGNRSVLERVGQRRSRSDIDEDTPLVNCSECGVPVAMDCVDIHKSMFCRARKYRKLEGGRKEHILQLVSGVQVSSNVVASREEVNRTHKDEFLAAKTRELENWKRLKVFEIVPFEDDMKNVISCTWVNTWKRTEGTTSQAKSRLVARGFEDLDADWLVTDSPTANKLNVRILLFWAAQNRYVPCSMDLKTAFLQSDSYSELSGRKVFLNPPKDVYEILNMPNNCVLRLLKCIYGLKDAPMSWFLTISKALKRYGLVQYQADFAVFFYFVDGIAEGVMTLHVDDILMAGSTKFWENIVTKLRSDFIVGSEVSKSFTYCGVSVESTIGKDTSVSIRVAQEAYTSSLELLEIPNGSESSMLVDWSYLGFRSRLGGLSWISLQSRPDVSYSVNQLSVIQANPCISDAKSLNKVLREATHQDRKSLGLQFSNLKDPCIVVIADGSFGRNVDGSSTGGFLVFVVDKSSSTVDHSFAELPDDFSVYRCCILDWRSYKLRRVTRSALASEVLACSDAMDHSFLVQSVWKVITGKSLEVHMYSDSLSLINSAFSNKGLSEKMLLINISAIRQALREKWLSGLVHIPTAWNAADCLTKYLSNKHLITTIMRDNLLPLPRFT